MSVNKYDPTTGLLTPVAGTENVVFGGATASTDGTRGLVPAPSAGDEGKALMADGTWDYAGELSWTGTLAQWNALSSSEKAEYVGKKIYITDDYETEGIPNFTGATASSDGAAGLVPQPHAGDEDKVLQGNGTFGKKLQIDVVKQGNEYGYINSNNVFVPFKSQADIDAAVSAAKVGDAVAGDVRSGKTFTNATTSGVVGTFAGQEKTVTATDSTIAVTPDSGKWLSKVNVNPKVLFQVGTMSTTKNIDRWNETWIAKTWNGISNFYGTSIWTDGNNIYYSNGTTQKVLNKSTLTWSDKTWNGLTDFSGYYIWTDGNNIYYSYNAQQYVLNKSNSTWTAKTWNGLTNFRGGNFWSDGDNIYYSYNAQQYVLNKSNSTWTAKTWSGLTSLLLILYFLLTPIFFSTFIILPGLSSFSLIIILVLPS